MERVGREQARAAKREGGGNYFVNPNSDRKYIPSGSTMFDLALGGGWARSRIANVVGDKSTGKTLLCIEAAANFIRLLPKAKVRYREAEAAFDKSYAEALGMPIKNVDFGSAIETVEQLWADLEAIVKGSRGPELVIVDSLDALSDEGEMSRDMNEGSYGAEKAKKMSQLFRRLVRRMEDKDVTLIIVSQVRDKIGVSFGRKTTRSGGKAMDFYASQVPYLAHIGQLSETRKGQKHVTGVEIKAKLDKNKVGLPFREAQFPILFGWGVDDITSMLNWFKENKLMKAADVAESEIKGYALDLIDGNIGNFVHEHERLVKIARREWFAIQKSLLPTRTKYGS